MTDALGPALMLGQMLDRAAARDPTRRRSASQAADKGPSASLAPSAADST